MAFFFFFDTSGVADIGLSVYIKCEAQFKKKSIFSLLDLLIELANEATNFQACKPFFRYEKEFVDLIFPLLDNTKRYIKLLPLSTYLTSLTSLVYHAMD